METLSTERYVSGKDIFSAGRSPSLGDCRHRAPSRMLAAGDMLITDSDPVTGGGRVLRIRESASRVRTEVIAAGGELARPSGLAFDRMGRLFVADPGARGGAGAVIEIDPETGRQTLLATGGLLADPRDILPGRWGELLVIDAGADGGRGAVIGVDSMLGKQRMVGPIGQFLTETDLIRTPLDTSRLLMVDSGPPNCPRLEGVPRSLYLASPAEAVERWFKAEAKGREMSAVGRSSTEAGVRTRGAKRRRVALAR